MPDERVTKVSDDVYEQIKQKADRDGTTMAEATKRLIEESGNPPTSCELTQFSKVLEKNGIILPQQLDLLWRLTEILPANLLAGTRLEPYAQARQQSELVCTLGDELYDKLVDGSGSVDEVIEEAEKAYQEAVAEPPASELADDPALPIVPSFDAEAEGEVMVDAASPSAEVEQETEPTEPEEV